MKRRTFLTSTGLGIGSILVQGSAASIRKVSISRENRKKEMQADLVIIGGGLGGCAAALAAIRNGLHVIMTEETDWIGGQMTQQGVPPDEHGAIESYGATQTYRDMRTRIREYYRRNYPLTAEAREQENLDPGNGGVSRICHEPRVSLAVLNAMLAPYISGKKLTILLNHHAVAAETEGDQVQSVLVKSSDTGNMLGLHAPYFIDATELGDLLPLTGTEYVTGFESQKDTGELHAPPVAEPNNIQACTWCFAMDYIDGEDNTIDKPEDYEFWRDYVPDLTPPWPGKLLSWTYSSPRSLKPTSMPFDPIRESKNEIGGFWRYRRIAYKPYHEEGTYPSDITLVNWPQNDFMLNNIYEVTSEEKRHHLHQAMQLSLSLLYWMQTEAPRADGGVGWPGLRLRKDILGTEHGLAKYPYIRESRRIKAEFTVLEQHVGREARMKYTEKDKVSAPDFPDSVGVGSYNIDLHPSTGGDNYIDVPSLRFQIPLGSLIPQRMENLLPGCKNLGVTHISNGCYRLHPVEWNIGESAGMLAVYCLRNKEKPRGVRNTERQLKDFQTMLKSQGIEIKWPG